MTPAPDPELPRNPYVGPRPFEPGETLFGRDREILELRYLLTAERIVLLYSPSGAGKSSLVNAGLLPRLKDDFEIWGPARVNREPPGDVANRYVWSIASSLHGEPLAPGIDWKDYLATRKPHSNPLIVFDQFEEILRVDPYDTDAKREFFEQTGEMLRDPSIWALFIIREDYLAPLEPYARLIPSHFRNRYRIDRLTRTGAAEAIEKPTRGRAEGYAPGVIETLVRDLATVKIAQLKGPPREEVGEHVEPVQLQVVCFDLWNRMLEAKLTSIAKVGNVQDALANYYAGCVTAASGNDRVTERRIRDWFGNQLITADGVRDQVRQEPDESCGGLQGPLVQKLVDTFMVRQEPRGASVWYELAHDRLVEPVRASNRVWLDANIEKFQKYAAQWARESHPEGLLLLGEDLADGQAWAAAHEDLLQDVDREFLAASAQKDAAINREILQTRKLKWWLRIAVAAALLAIGFGVYAMLETRRAKEQQLAANAELAAGDDATIGAYVGYRAAKMGKPLPTGLENMFAGLLAGPTSYMIQREEVVVNVAWSPDGKRFATAAGKSDGNVVRVRDADSGDVLWEVFGHTGAVTSVAWSPDGKWLASAGADKTVRLWDAVTHNASGTLTGHIDGVTSLAWSPDGKTLASTSRDKTIRLWAAGGQALRTLAGHAGAVNAVAWSPDGARLISAGDDKSVITWTAAGELLYREAQLAPALSVALSPDSTRIAIGHSDATIWLSKFGTPTRHILYGHKGAVRRVVWSPDGKTLASAGDDKVVRFWDPDGMELPTLDGHSSGILAIAFSPDGRRFASAAEDKELRLWDMVETGSRTLKGHRKRIDSVAWSPDGKTLATSGADSSIRLWDPATGGARRVLSGHAGDVWSLAWNPDGRTLASAGGDGTVRLWDSARGTLLRTIGAHRGEVNAVAWSPDGKALASGGDDNTVKLWDASSGSVLRTVKGFSEKDREDPVVWSVAWSPDGKTLAFSSSNTVALLDVAAGAVLRTLRAHTGIVYCARWSPDGKELVSVGDDGRIIVWNSATGMIENQLDLNHDRVRNAAWSPDGSALAVASLDSIAVLDTETGDFTRNMKVPGEDFIAVAYSPDSRILASAGAGQVVRLWPGNVDTLLDEVRRRIRFFTLKPDACRHFFQTERCEPLH